MPDHLDRRAWYERLFGRTPEEERIAQLEKQVADISYSANQLLDSKNELAKLEPSALYDVLESHLHSGKILEPWPGLQLMMRDNDPIERFYDVADVPPARTYRDWSKEPLFTSTCIVAAVKFLNDEVTSRRLAYTESRR